MQFDAKSLKLRKGRYCDAMAVVRELGKPSYFITMTCNPKWKEIVDNLPNGLKAHQCPDLVARVFKMKLDSLLDDLRKKRRPTAVDDDVVPMDVDDPVNMPAIEQDSWMREFPFN